MSLLEKLKAAGSIKVTTLAESTLFNEKDNIPISVPILNVAFSGKLDGGLIPGLTVFAGPSRHFKSSMGLICMKAYLDKYPESIALFYDSEYGVTPEYISSYGIDAERVLHIPIEHIEQLKFDIAKRLDEVTRGDKIFIFIDSVGNLASKKEVEDALDEKSVADMSRSKALKSLFRIVTPHLTTKDIPCIVIGHTYQTMEMFSKQVLAGGTGMMYSANQVFMIGRAQDKDGTELSGYNFTLNVDKSRFVREKSKLPLNVSFEGGVSEFSGLLDLALESGHVQKPKNGWYFRTYVEGDKNVREKETNSREFWSPIVTDESFKEFVKNKFQLSTRRQVVEEETDV